MNSFNGRSVRISQRKQLLNLIDAVIISASYAFIYVCSLLSGYINVTGHAIESIHILEILLITAIYICISMVFRMNNVIWRYAGGHEYLSIFVVSTVGGAAACALSEALLRTGLPALFYLFGMIFSTSMLVASRVIYRESCNLRRKNNVGPNAKRLLIIGAGNAGSRLIQEIRLNPEFGLLPIGLLDDNPDKLGRSIFGVKILGAVNEVQRLSKREKADLIYIAIPSITNEQRAVILEKCSETGCTVRILPYYTEIADEKRLINSVRDITPEELLGREPVKVADESILNFVRGKTVAITGGGGSIGSEICRQVAANQPKRLVIIDVYENNAYAIQQELVNQYGDKLDLEVYIATVCDYGKINALFAKERPNIVIHAAAHKHVPLMETVPDEAVKNNVFGTFNTALAARENKVGKMILISTDKAVNPTNIMGTTKRICEMIIQYADSISPDTSYAAVRFGNVLGSNGSVIPLFKNQIESHHDVTVTHPDIIRYFMTISEASQLVLTASAMAKGGEIFVLDMGAPVRIDDLARKMISLAGLTLGRDINIRYIGLRPGEKLYEELLMSEEGLNKTPNHKIYIGRTIPMNFDTFRRELDELKLLVNNPAAANLQIEKKLMQIVPTFKRAPLKTVCEASAAEPRTRETDTVLTVKEPVNV